MNQVIPEIGEIVKLRQRQYFVENIEEPSKEGLATRVDLSCLDDDAQGQPLSVFWELENDAEVLSGERWDQLTKKGFDDPEIFSAYMHTMRWNCVTSTNPKLFQSPFRAGIKIEPYQLEPLRKALLLPRVNMFIADDVGLGKTIEAGLIARELLLRKKVDSIVVACPPSMLLQWKEELEIRFGLIFEIYDKDFIAKMRRERGYKINPWNTHSRFLISHKLLIDENYASPMREWLGELKHGSLLILDEAHHAAPSSGSKYAIDSKFTKSIRDLAARFEHRLFLSATPHNGHSNSFSSLLEILDPQRFFRGEKVTDKKLLDEIMVRRLKEDIRNIVEGFPKRNVVQIDINELVDDSPELRLSVLLNEYRELREERMKGKTKKQQASASLLIIGLQQRLLSSIEAFFKTLHVHRRTMLKHWCEELDLKTKVDSNKLNLVNNSVDGDDEEAELSTEELEEAVESQFEQASMAGLETADKQNFENEKTILEEMYSIANNARYERDAKLKRICEWIKENMCPTIGTKGAEWNDLKIIIFTEWDDTKRYIVNELQELVDDTDLGEERISVFHGPTSRDKREEIKRAFNNKDNPLRILVATDAAREGLNLQSQCHNLFHYDIPWNPSRMEQRNGRIDRKLQPSPEVFCHYFVYQQRVEDRILEVLVKKTETIKKELGSLAQVIDTSLSKKLREGMKHNDADRLMGDIEQADLDKELKESIIADLEQTRLKKEEIKKSITDLEKQLESSRKWLGLDEEHFRRALSSSLKIVGAPPLSLNSESKTFEINGLEEKVGSSWGNTIDALRKPRGRKQKIWEWRKEAPVRPLVFQDSGIIDDSTVHIHLEHRLTKRLLGRFQSQGFLNDDISRACLLQSKDSVARVVLLTRFTVYGPNASRLHEELIPITAKWTDPNKRKSPITPYSESTENLTLELLEEALLQSKHEINKKTADLIKESGDRDVDELLPFLKERAIDLHTDVRDKLLERGRKESESMRDLLEKQKKRILKETKDYDESKQLEMNFSIEEKNQIKSNRKYWDLRLEKIKEELKVEPDRIKELYEPKTYRFEPVGLIYLFPEGKV
ncbi:MAG: DISARM system SNF2-like helicase DrmD [Bacteriovoracaceae bacterium]|nr:DISARM system SNF2-like helicase DrmD [Bacteriovoracaceae bacterium]